MVTLSLVLLQQVYELLEDLMEAVVKPSHQPMPKVLKQILCD